MNFAFLLLSTSSRSLRMIDNKGRSALTQAISDAVGTQLDDRVTQKKRRQLPLNPVEITLTTEDALDQLSYFDYDFKLNIK